MTTAQRRDLRSEIRDEIEEIDADMTGWKYDLDELKKPNAAAKARKAELRARYKELRTNAASCPRPGPSTGQEDR